MGKETQKNRLISVDTSVLVRYLTNDDPVKATAFREYLERSHGLFISDVVWAETYYTLVSFYNYSRTAVVTQLALLLNHPVVIANQEIVSSVLDILQNHSISFVDAYTAVLAKQETASIVLSYDRDFDKIDGIKRREP